MKLFRATTAALLLGAATLAVAQTRAESFADQFKQMQTLQSFGTYTFKPKPTLGNKHADPSGKESLASMVSRMQALQSFGTYTFKPPPTFSSEPADPVGKESFASMFSRMQAGSSNSDEWKLPPSDGAPTYATASGATVASESGKPTLAERIARALHARGSGSSQSN